MIKNEAPSVSSFQFRGGKLKLLLGESLQLKNLNIDCSHSIIYYARKELPSSAPNLESLTIYSTYEVYIFTLMTSNMNISVVIPWNINVPSLCRSSPQQWRLASSFT
jgi:hypothetical protein